MICVMANENKPNVTEFQRRWPSFQAFADDAGVSYGLAQTWRTRNMIPADYDFDIAEKGAGRKIGSFKDILQTLRDMRLSLQDAA
jgi:hypothetical protein